eukprot:Gb_41125 [translate_table: standard]
MKIGLIVVDSLVVIGHGQINNQGLQTRKITIAIDIRNMNSKGTSDSEKMYIVYVAIGKKCSTMVQLVLFYKDALEYSIIIAAISSDLAPP